MKFGVYTSVDNSEAVKATGWDFVEENVQTFLEGAVPDDQWRGAERLGRAVLAVPAANRLVPAHLKLTGPEADLGKLRDYITRVLDRAGRTGTTTLVFGSGAARRYPDGFDRATARRQILDFLRMALPIARRNGVTIVAEPLNRGECNIMNSVAESMEYVRELDHPNFRCLVDSYHVWLDDEPLDGLRDAMPWIRHVHVSDLRDRMAAGESGEIPAERYRAFFRVLREGGYDGMITVEADTFDVARDGRRVLQYLKEQWNTA
jgi:sugar phosphate isomerase/epimerase